MTALDAQGHLQAGQFTVVIPDTVLGVLFGAALMQTPRGIDTLRRKE